MALRWPVMVTASCDGLARQVALASSALPTVPPPPGGPQGRRQEALQLPCWRWGHRGLPSSSISPLGSAPRRAWAPGLFYTDSLLLSLSLSVFVTESGGPGARGILGGGGPALLPEFLSHPGCCFGPAATPSPLVPVEACPVLVLPMPSTTRNLAPISALGQARGVRMDE